MNTYEVRWAGDDWRKSPTIVKAASYEKAAALAERAYPGRKAGQVIRL